MKVKQLIEHLKKMPQNLEVYWADHDHGTYETNSLAGRVRLIDKSTMDEWDIEHLDDCFKDTPQKYVVIRPR